MGIEGTHAEDNLIAGDFDIVTEAKTLVSGQSVVKGEILGRITASGKYAMYKKTHSDGTETPDVIAAETVDASAGDAPIITYLSGQYNQNAITLPTVETVDNTLKDALRTKSIFLVESVQTDGTTN